MGIKGLFIDYQLCIGCHTCEVACKQEHDIPTGVKWVRVVEVGPRKVGNALKLNYIPVLCKHCSKPPCIEICPEKAITRREDGPVLIKDELCIGCKQCIEVCPFGAIDFNPRKEIVEKCSLCIHRIEQGLRPSCEQHCPTGAIFFGCPNEFAELRRKRVAEMIAQNLEVP